MNDTKQPIWKLVHLCAQELTAKPLRIVVGFAAGGAHDIVARVLGPATAGGYYVIGLRRPAPELLAGISWSSPNVL